MKYILKVGYGDYYWDLGEDVYYCNTLEELWELFLENVYSSMVTTKEAFIKMMIEDGYAEDDDGMWYATSV